MATSTIGQGKELDKQTKDIVYNVYTYFESLQAKRTRSALDKTAEATGVSKSSVSNIVKKKRSKLTSDAITSQEESYS